MVTPPANDQTSPGQTSPGQKIPIKPLADLVEDASRLMAAENISGAERILWEAARRFPGERDIWIVIVGFLLVRHRRAEAVDPARRSILLAPEKDGAVREYMRVLIGSERTVEAKRVSKMLVMLRPGSAEAWLWFAGMSTESTEKTARRQALNAAEEAGQDQPSVLWSVAIQRFVDGNGAAARRTVDRYLEEISRSASSEIDGLVDYTRLLVRHSRWREAADRTEVLAAPLHADLVRVRHISRAMLSMEAEEGAEEKVDLLMVLPLWGIGYADFWLDYSLASMLEPENRRALEGRSILFLMPTTEETLAHCEKHPLFQMLKSLVTVKTIDITPVLADRMPEHDNFVLTVGWWIGLFEARRRGAALLVLVGDYIMSAGSLAYALGRHDSGAVDVTFTLDLPTSNRAKQPLDAHRGEDGTIALSCRELGDIYLGATSVRFDSYLFDPNATTLPSEPSRINLRWEDGLEIRSLQPQLFIAEASLLDELETPNLACFDNGFVEWALGATGSVDRMEFLAEPEKFLCAAVDFNPEERLAAGQFAVRVPITDPLRDLAALFWRRGYLTRGRIWAFKQGILITTDGPATRRGLMDELAERVPVPREDTYQTFARRILRPAWNAFAKRRGA